VIEYQVPDRDGDSTGELIALITTITQMTAAPAPYWRRHTTKGGNTKPETASSSPTCVVLAGSCGPRARTWCARRSTAIY